MTESVMFTLDCELYKIKGIILQCYYFTFVIKCSSQYIKDIQYISVMNLKRKDRFRSKTQNFHRNVFTLPLQQKSPPGTKFQHQIGIVTVFILTFSTPEIAAIEPLHSQNVPGTEPDSHLFIFLQIIILGILPLGHLVCILIKVQRRMFFTEFIPKAFLSSSARKPENCLR